MVHGNVNVRVGGIDNLLMQSPSFSGSVSWVCDFHKYFSSGIEIFFFCLLPSPPQAAFSVCVLEALAPVDSSSFSETG